MNELCQKCVDIFADHEEARCAIALEQMNLLLLDLWNSLTADFVKFIGTMAKHARGILKGSCPLCKAQEEQHNYTMCLQTAKIKVERGMLKITMGQGCLGQPLLDPNPMGSMPGTTPKPNPKTPSEQPKAKSPAKGTASEDEMVHLLLPAMHPLCQPIFLPPNT